MSAHNGMSSTTKIKLNPNMQYRTDPKSGNQLSALGFGCMRFPKSAALCEELVTTAVNAGINYFDTAYIYPGSEPTLGSILKKHGLREKIFLADKLPHFLCKNTSDVEKVFQKSLKRLQVEYLDYYLIHNIGSLDAWKRLERLGITEWIAEKKAAELIHQIGFSFHGKSVDFVPLLDAYDWEFCLIQYNYMNENYQAGTAGLKAIHERGMPAFIMEPLLGGKLAQKLPLEAKKLFDQTTQGRTPAEWAFKWLWDKPEVTVVLSGMNAMEPLNKNLETVKNSPADSLTDEERAVYDKACRVISEAYKVPCTGCDYCMPCPSGVNIPACFSAYNMSYVMGWLSGMQLYVNATMGLGAARSSPANCSQCGVCLKQCPQGIPIPNRLKDVQKRLEPLPIQLLLNTVKRFMG
jgi:predicted aldo/keto reductase-like oxidoreductase